MTRQPPVITLPTVRPGVPRRLNDESREEKAPPARPRERVSSESIGWWTSAAAAGYATFSEFLPTSIKAFAGTILASAAAAGAFKAWRSKIDERRKQREDR